MPLSSVQSTLIIGVDRIITTVSDELERPGYNKSPLDALIRIRELVDLEERHIKIAVPTSSEAVNRNLFHPFNGNEFLNHMLKDEGLLSWNLAQDLNFISFVEKIDRYLAKQSSGVAAVEGEPGAKPRRMGHGLKPAKRQTDVEPGRLGPTGTWVNSNT